MAAAGLLQQPGRTLFLELGAGKAWLTAWLHMLHPSTHEFILLDKFAAFNNKVRRVLCLPNDFCLFTKGFCPSALLDKFAAFNNKVGCVCAAALVEIVLINSKIRRVM
jgi:hypothetical protein